MVVDVPPVVAGVLGSWVGPLGDLLVVVVPLVQILLLLRSGQGGAVDVDVVDVRAFTGGG